MKNHSSTQFVELRHVTKVFCNSALRRAHIRALADICIEVFNGEIFALIGPNGAGKSTCMKIIAGITHPTSGHVRILERPSSDISVRDDIGYLPEQIPLPAQMTPLQFLTLTGRLNGIKTSILKDRIREVVDFLRIAKFMTVPMKKFSKGMIQKIGFAQAIIHKPRLLLLDEPSDGLDPLGRKEMREFLNNYRDDGNSIFLNSHLISEIEMLADRLAIINDGSVVKSGTLREFTSPEEYIEIAFNGALPAILKNESKNFRYTTSGNMTKVEMLTPFHLGRILELMSYAGISPSYINTKQRSLEDAYLSITNGDNH